MPSALAQAFLCLALGDVQAIYVVPLSHTDIGFTAPPSEVAEKASQSADDAIAQAKKDPAYVWCFETFWQLEAWLERHKDPEPVLELLRAGRFGLSAAYSDPHSSLMSAWCLDQQFRVPVEWARSHQITLDWAMMNDVPGHPHDLPLFLARHGIRYLVLGVNQGFSKLLPDEISNAPFWWEGPEKSRVLTWISADSYTDAYTKYGVDPGTARFFAGADFPEKEAVAVMRGGIARMLERFRRRNYSQDCVLALHGFDNWGSSASQRLPDAARAWNAARKPGDPELIVSTPREFFRRIESKYGEQLPVRRGGFGGQWEAVRTAAPTAMARARAEEAWLAKEATPNPRRVHDLLVYWEHSFGLGAPWPGHMTREQAVQHNAEQWDLVKGWPLVSVNAVAGVEVELERPVGGEAFETNGLRIAVVDGGKLGSKPLDPAAWLERHAERLPDGTIRLRHSIDRRRLPDPAHLLWTWKLTPDEQDAPVELDSATGRITLPRDALLGYDPGHWIVRDSFRLARSRFVPRGIFVFSRPKEHRGWLVARVLDQGLGAQFKDGKRGRMTFEEAYPGEDPIFEPSIEVRKE